MIWYHYDEKYDVKWERLYHNGHRITVYKVGEKSYFEVIRCKSGVTAYKSREYYPLVGASCNYEAAHQDAVDYVYKYLM